MSLLSIQIDPMQSLRRIRYPEKVVIRANRMVMMMTMMMMIVTLDGNKGNDDDDDDESIAETGR